MPAPVSPLVGRSDDLDRLTAVVTDARAGSGTGVLLLGDAGVGKTRLVSEVTEAAAGTGALVLAGHCVHRGGSVPYLPVIDALRVLRQEDYRSVLSAHPAVAELLAPAAQGRQLTTADLYEDIVGVLLSLAAEAPVLLLVEDAHWADAATRDLLGYLLNRLPGSPVAVIVTVRADDLHRRHPLRPTLAEWSRLPGISRLTLAPLTDSDIRALVAARHPEPLSDEVLHRVSQRSGGNPFYLEQLLDAVDRTAGLPADLVDLVLVQVEDLSPDARRVVQLAAVAGTTVGHDLLAQLAGLSDLALDAALREATEAHVLVATAASGYSFRHALLAEAVYDDLLPGERVRLHAAFAAALSDQDPRSDADLARHAEESLDLVTAYTAGIRAADAAMELAAPADALVLYERAGRLAGQVGSAEPVRLALRTAEAAAQSGHPFRALQVIERALAEHPTVDAHRAELLIDLARHGLNFDGRVDPIQLTTQALELLDPEPPTALRARAVSVHARAFLDGMRYRESVSWATEALGAATTLGLGSIVTEAAATRARASSLLGDLDVAEPMLREAVTAAVEAGDVATEIRAWHGLAGIRHQRGDLTGQIEALRGAVDRGDSAGRPFDGYSLYSRGRLIIALAETGQLTEALALSDPPGAPAYARSFLETMSLPVLLARADDRVPQVIARAQRWAPDDGMIEINASFADIVYRGRVLQDVAGALAAHDRAVTTLMAQWKQMWFAGRIRLHAVALGVMTRAEAGRAAALVSEAHRTADHVAGRAPFMSPEAQAWLTVVDAEALRLRWLADAGDRPGGAELVTAWESAVAGFGYGNLLEATRARLRLAEVLTATGDRATAITAAKQALADARGMGATALVAAAHTLLAAEARDPEPTGLTPRERQVLTLVGDGLSNREIGRQLYIADKTVSVHVSNILAKLDASSRTEAVAVARRQGMLTD